MKTDFLFTKKDTAYFFNVNPRAIDNWTIDPAEKIGRRIYFDIKDVYDYLQQKKKEKSGTLTEQRTRLVKAQANKAELEAEALEGNLIPVNIVSDVWADQISNCRAKLLSIPNRSAKILEKKTAKEIESKLMDLIYEALNELADYEPETYRLDSETVAEYKKDIQTTAKINRQRVVKRKKKTKS
jgi:phage terminase Nu1 subunit (DNA packaging protein)